MTNQQLLYAPGLLPVRKINLSNIFVETSDLIIETSVIDEAVRCVTGYSIDELRVKKRSRELVEARQIGMFFYKLAGYSIDVSGMTFMRDHATVIHSTHKIMNLYGRNGESKLTDMVNKVSELTGINLPYNVLN